MSHGQKFVTRPTRDRLRVSELSWTKPRQNPPSRCGRQSLGGGGGLVIDQQQHSSESGVMQHDPPCLGSSRSHGKPASYGRLPAITASHFLAMSRSGSHRPTWSPAKSDFQPCHYPLTGLSYFPLLRGDTLDVRSCRWSRNSQSMATVWRW